MRSFATMDAFLRHLATLPRGVEEAERHGLHEAGERLVEQARAVLGTYDARPEWAKLADATVAKKRTGDSPLLETGDLWSSIGSRVDGRGVLLGSTSKIAPFQEFGTNRIPPRPFIASTLFAHGQQGVRTVARHVMGAVAGDHRPLPPSSEDRGK